MNVEKLWLGRESDVYNDDCNTKISLGTDKDQRISNTVGNMGWRRLEGRSQFRSKGIVTTPNDCTPIGVRNSGRMLDRRDENNPVSRVFTSGGIAISPPFSLLSYAEARGFKKMAPHFYEGGTSICRISPLPLNSQKLSFLLFSYTATGQHPEPPPNSLVSSKSVGFCSSPSSSLCHPLSSNSSRPRCIK
ncbi:hypothetical protein H6P81_009267 [Aristolochia fimbriata]|uniref:Uncharacterized protein n=1 Tax=Aristolochia fimbriata TaxID=158543 RepID=A0AAV7EKD4_ARIFI|nr:hypothetical protein H6P81_009267 [Aristolochia fimbriata]